MSSNFPVFPEMATCGGPFLGDASEAGEPHHLAGFGCRCGWVKSSNPTYVGSNRGLRYASLTGQASFWLVKPSFSVEKAHGLPWLAPPILTKTCVTGIPRCAGAQCSAQRLRGGLGLMGEVSQAFNHHL